MARDTIPEGYVSVGTLTDALHLLDDWIAYGLRMKSKCRNAELRAEYLEDLLRHLDPFLPQIMQDVEARKREPGVYKAIAELQDDEEFHF